MNESEPELPSPLPRRLGDPLRFYRWLVIIVVLLGVISFLLPQLRQLTEEERTAVIYKAGSTGILFGVIGLLPWRLTNAFYLRSFRRDGSSGRLRQDVQKALGSDFRLSGIRDPRRRWPWLLRHCVYLLFLIRYASPKHMNLEAGPDWKPRLWRSLGDARCVFLDIRDLTSFVREEVELSVESMGLNRVLFVVDDTRSLDEWREVIRSILKLPELDLEVIRLALWADTPTGRREFRQQIRAFRDSLPESVAGVNLHAFPGEAAKLSWFERLRSNLRMEFLLATLVLGLLVLILVWSNPPELLIQVLEFASLGYMVLAVVLMLLYLVDSVPLMKKVRILILIAFGTALFLTPLLPRITLTDSLHLMSSQNNTKQIGLSIWNYADVHNGMPPGDLVSAEGTPLLSWRVLLLPYVEHEALFSMFRLDEPWDSPHNIQLLELMPKVYHAPYPTETQQQLGMTHYVRITGPGTLWGEATPETPKRPYGFNTFIREAPFKLRSFQGDGPILLVEAANPVPWTKPEDIVYTPPQDRSRPEEFIERLGPSPIGVGVLFTDTSFQSIPHGDHTTLDAMIARTLMDESELNGER